MLARARRQDDDRSVGRDDRERRAVRRGAAPADGGVPVAVRARPAALHRRRRSASSATTRRRCSSRRCSGLGRRSWGAATPAEDDAGFMLFDTVLAFDHVKHRILIIANARITADEDLRALYQFACAKIQFLERELERGLSQAPDAGRRAPTSRSNQTARELRDRRPDDQGAHRRRRHLPGGPVAALRNRRHGRSVHRLPRAAARQPVALHVFHPHGRAVDRRIVAGDAGPRGRPARRDASDRRHAAARDATRTRTCASARS